VVVDVVEPDLLRTFERPDEPIQPVVSAPEIVGDTVALSRRRV
jgi:hypothetical protein